MKKVLFVWGKEASFFAMSIQDKLEAQGMETLRIEFTVDQVSEQFDQYDLIVLYVGAESLAKEDLLIYLRDTCIEKDKKLCLIGDGDCLEKGAHYLNDNIVVSKYKRPIDVNDVVAGIEKILTELGELKQRYSIMVVDDSPIMLRTVKGWFAAKYNVSMANSATMAISLLAKNKPDLILLDYEMPLCSGPQFLEMIHAEKELSNIPIIFLTSKNDNDSVKGAINLKPAGYLLKTMEPRAIVEYVDTFFIQLEVLNKQKEIK